MNTINLNPLPPPILLRAYSLQPFEKAAETCVVSKVQCLSYLHNSFSGVLKLPQRLH